MKTITCDTCGKTIKHGRNQGWSEFRAVFNQIQSVTMEVVCIEGKDLDICGRCSTLMTRWVKKRLKELPDE